VTRVDFAVFIMSKGNDGRVDIREDQLKELMQIPGVGKSISRDLLNIGIRSVNDLKKKRSGGAL